MLLTLMILAAGWPLATDVRPEVKAAHQSYLKADWAQFSRDVHHGLEAVQGDARSTENLLELLDAAFDARAGKLPVDFTLPAGVRKLKVGTKRRENAHTGNIVYRLEVYAELDQGVLEQVRVERFPNTLVLDKRAGLGEFDLTAGDEKGVEDLWGGTECLDDAPLPGLYVLTVKTVGGPETKAWFALHGHVSSASPYLSSPGAGEKTGPRPTVRWSDFKSPQLKRFEKRNSSLLLFDPAWNVIWSHWADDLEHREVTVDKDLLPGPYELVLKFQERRKFGELVVARDSATAVPFEVRAR